MQGVPPHRKSPFELVAFIVRLYQIVILPLSLSIYFLPVVDLPVRTIDKAAHDAGNSGACTTGQVGSNSRNEATVGIGLACIPHHDTTEAGEGLAIFNDGLEVGCREITGRGGTSVGGHT